MINSIILLAAIAIAVRDLPSILLRNAPVSSSIFAMILRVVIALSSIQLSIYISGVDINELSNFIAIIKPLFWIGLTFIPLFPNLFLLFFVSEFIANILNVGLNSELMSISAYMLMLFCFLIPEIVFQILYRHLPRMRNIQPRIDDRYLHRLNNRVNPFVKHLTWSIGTKAGVVSSIVLGFPTLIISLILSPLELLMFNRGWSSTYTRNKNKTIETSPKGFIVYFDGVGKSSLLNTYAAHNVKRYVHNNLTHWEVITDLMPYSPLNLPLTQVRMTSSLWLFFKGITDSAVMIFRNIIQVLTMHDIRYRHDYTQALAKHTIDRLMHSGYQANAAQPIVLIGYSGGAGVATLIASTLMEKLGTPKVTVLTIGGFFEAHPKTKKLKILCLESKKDYIARFGRKILPWNLNPYRPKFQIINALGMSHLGNNGYLSSSVSNDEKMSFADISLHMLFKHM